MFLHDSDSKLLQGDPRRNCNEPYERLPEAFTDILNHQFSLKEKQIKDNHAPFTTEELSKAITEKLKTKNEYLKWSFWENYLTYKKC